MPGKTGQSQQLLRNPLMLLKQFLRSYETTLVPKTTHKQIQNFVERYECVKLEKSVKTLVYQP